MKDKGATIVTFYSYKGGVGRSMALANVAWLLAEESRRKVLVVDWDLEAPGLHRFFGLKDADISKGLIEILNQYKELLRTETGSLPERLVDLRKYVQLIKPFSSGGSISILAAGGQQDVRAYAAAINAFSWEDFYANWRGFGFIEHLKEQLRTFDDTDIVLVDSRTGVTDIGGICTLQLPDVVVILFAMNDQNIVGAKSVAERISKKAGELEGRDAPPILILRPARVERSSGNQDKKLEWQAKAASQLGEYFTDRDPEAVIAKKNIPYVSDFSYGETPLAVVKDPLGDITDSFKDLADAIIRASEGIGSEESRFKGDDFTPREKLLKFLAIQTRLFISRTRKLKFPIAIVLLITVAALSFVRIRQLSHAASASQLENTKLQDTNRQLQKQLDEIRSNNAPAPTPVETKGYINIQLADDEQRTKALELADALRKKGYCVADDIELIDQKPNAAVPSVTLVKYFWDDDEDGADDIADTVEEKTGEHLSRSSNPYLQKGQPGGYYEIWFGKSYRPQK